ncbi:MAG: radical SAM peptide maturase, CXXX-repeat target family [Ruminococcus flavefaciens]|nr:radical SAM peptide maturase, CXXX-repeat target family [Ruminococcus flavefaciens]
MRPKVQEYHDTIARLFPDPNRSVRAVTLQVTDSCNLRCTYCYQICKQSHIIDIDTAKKYLLHILEGDNPYINFDNTCGIVLEFIGGEPFIAIDVISEITEWVYQYMIDHNHPWMHRFKISICSNGVLYFDPKVQAYLNKWHRIMSLSISIDGCKELHDACRIFPSGEGSYDIAAKAAKDWISRYGEFGLGSKMTFAPENVAWVSRAIINLITEFGFRSINCNCCFEEGWTLEHAQILYHELNKTTDWLEEHNLMDDVYISIFTETGFCPMSPEDNRNWCGGTGEMIAVDWKGDIYPCIRYMESSLGTDAPPLIIGTVDGGIQATQEQCERVQCLQCITRRSQSTDECWNCPIASGCAWCSGYNYQKFGTVNHRATFICVMHKARALANAYFWYKYHKHHPTEPWNDNYCIPNEWALEIIGEDELNRLKAVMAE